MQDPVFLVGDGRTYERAEISRWLAQAGTSPTTGLPLTAEQQILVQNYDLKSSIAALEFR